MAGLQPALGQCLSVGAIKGTEVGDASTGKEDVTNKLVDGQAKTSNGLLPPDSFVSEKHDELFSTAHSVFGTVHVELKIGLVLLHFLDGRHQIGNLLLDLVYFSKLDIELGLRGGEHTLHLGQLLLLGNNLLPNNLIFGKCERPSAKSTSSLSFCFHNFGGVTGLLEVLVTDLGEHGLGQVLDLETLQLRLELLRILDSFQDVLPARLLLQ